MWLLCCKSFGVEDFRQNCWAEVEVSIGLVTIPNARVESMSESLIFLKALSTSNIFLAKLQFM